MRLPSNPWITWQTHHFGRRQTRVNIMRAPRMPPARRLIGARTRSATLSPACAPPIERHLGRQLDQQLAEVGMLAAGTASAAQRNRSGEPSAGRQ